MTQKLAFNQDKRHQENCWDSLSGQPLRRQASRFYAHCHTSLNPICGQTCARTSRATTLVRRSSQVDGSGKDKSYTHLDDGWQNALPCRHDC